MTTPPWGHKPPPVECVEDHWLTPPPEPSQRCRYWVRRLQEGSWTPNKWLTRQGYYGAASHLGVWIWEERYVLSPLFREHWARQRGAQSEPLTG